jgi:transcriptional regulator with XRE-family HTH domain
MNWKVTERKSRFHPKRRVLSPERSNRSLKTILKTAVESKMKNEIVQLGRTVRRVRENLNLSLRDLEDLIGISASTLSRVERGRCGSPDAETIAAITNWLGTSLENVLRAQPKGGEYPIVYHPDKSLPEIVEEQLTFDKTMSPEAANCLSDIFRRAYEHFAGSSRNV